MVRSPARSVFALAALLTSTAALACADPGCEGPFNLMGLSQSCQGRAMLSPGNDSRVNLMLLLGDQGNRSLATLKPTPPEYGYITRPTVFLDWSMLRSAFFPVAETAEGGADYSGSRCQSYAGGSAALLAAMQGNRALLEGERSAIASARAKAEEVCRQGTSPARAFAAWPAVTSAPGREFLGYAQSADAFYGERWDEARQGFAALSGAGDPFVRETAAYMLIRVEFAAAQAGAFDEYGFYDGNAKVDAAAAKRGLQALSAYLKGWPGGRYSGSAQGLLRRGLWLARDYAALGGAYSRLLRSASPQQEASARLIEEIDNKLLFNSDAANVRAQGALLLAAQDLVAMRSGETAEGAAPRPSLSAADLDAQASEFAGQTELFSYLQATHAFYHGGDYRKVLGLLPDDAKRPAYSNLAFSRQVLRGMALAALKDRNETAFWQDLLGGAKGPWQRPLAELGLAMNLERGDRLAAVFAPQSPVTNAEIRARLIDRAAGPELLRTIIGAAGNPAEERDLALYTLLANELVRGRYAAFGSDLKLPLASRKSAAAAFRSGRVSDGYACGPLAATAARLAADPADIPARLCLGDFFRLNGLDYLHGRYDTAPQRDELGGYAVGFPGKRNFRSEFYAAAIADPRARGDDRAYALYRSVMCYAPSGNNDCGGADVAIGQRKAWFERLKREHPQSPWARKLRYYW